MPRLRFFSPLLLLTVMIPKDPRCDAIAILGFGKALLARFSRDRRRRSLPGPSALAVAIRNEPVILPCHRSRTMRLRVRASRTPLNTAIVAVSWDSALRANLAQKRPVPSLEELNDGDKIEVVRREIASQVDRSVERLCSAKQDQQGR
jgi:hypothetical protein